KPLAPIAGKSLLAHLVRRLQDCGLETIECALREELLTAEDKRNLPAESGLKYLFVNTESSLHTLVELISSMGTNQGPVLFSMADTILKTEDLLAFVRFCAALAPDESAVLVTTFI